MVASPPRRFRALSFPIVAGTALFMGLLAATPLAAQPVDQPFTFNNVATTLPFGEHVDMLLGDVDGDGDLDMLMTGLFDGIPKTHLFLYTGAGDGTVLFESASHPAPGVAFSGGAWGDYDGDGDLDLVVSGSRTATYPYDPATTLLRNDEGELTVVADAFADVFAGAAEWGDVDNDGDLDLVLGGERADGASVATLYRNDDGTFVAVQTLPGLAHGAAAWGDADGDGDLDLALSGMGPSGSYTEIFRNDGGELTAWGAGLAPTLFTTLTWGDVDRDGDLDLLQTGGRWSAVVLDAYTRLYRNDGGVFSAMDVPLPDLLSGDASFADFDDDGDLDLHVMGAEDALGRRLDRIYENRLDEDAGTLHEKIRLIGVVFGDAVWGDLEGDGDLDLFTTGTPTAETPFVMLNENRRQVRPDPEAPSGLSADVAALDVVLRWDAQPGTASYNVRVGTAPGRSDVASAMANPATGRRLLVRRGNAEAHPSHVLRGLQSGTYYWSVQALDGAHSGSPFSDEQHFSIGIPTAQGPAESVPLETALLPISPNPSAGPVHVRFELRDAGPVRLSIFDVLGRHVATVVNAHTSAGAHELVWEPDGLAAGLYIFRLETGGHHVMASFLRTR